METWDLGFPRFGGGSGTEGKEEPLMNTRPGYPPEFRQRMVDLVRSGRLAESLSREFTVTATSIRKWVRQANLDTGRQTDGLTTDERQELNSLRRENRVLREE